MLDPKLSADDILLGLLALGGSKEMRFNALSRDVHAALLGVKTEFPDLFGDFAFTATTTSFPYCEQLSRSLRNLEWTRLIGVENPDFRVYSVKQSARTVFEQAVLPLASHSQRAQLTGASKRLWDRLRCNQCE